MLIIGVARVRNENPFLAEGRNVPQIVLIEIRKMTGPDFVVGCGSVCQIGSSSMADGSVEPFGIEHQKVDGRAAAARKTVDENPALIDAVVFFD